MNLRAIVSVSGKSGLFKLIGQNKSGFVLESLDDQKVKTVVNMSNTKMATLEDITIFCEEDDIRLPDILEAMKDEANIPDAKKADGNTLRAFFRTVAPAHDEERVYASDIKKIISWFLILKELPLFEEEEPESIEEKQEIDAIVAEKTKAKQEA